MVGGVTNRVHNDPHLAVGLGIQGTGELIARGALVHKAVSVFVHKDAVAPAGVNVLDKARAKRAAGVHLNVREPDKLGARLFGQEQAVSLSADRDVGAADSTRAQVDVAPYAVVHALAVLRIGAETACGDNDGLGIHGDGQSAAVQALDAGNGAVFVEQDMLGGTLGNDADLVGVLGDVIAERVGVAAAAVLGVVVAALTKRARGRADLHAEGATQVLEPLHRLQGVFGHELHELGVRHVVAAFHGDPIELLNGVLDALLFLTVGVHGVQCAAADVG